MRSHQPPPRRRQSGALVAENDPRDSLDVQILHAQRVVLDEAAARLDLVAHQRREDLVGLVGVLDTDLQQRARLRVHRRFPELLRVHLTEPFVALHVESLAALREQLGHGGAERRGLAAPLARTDRERLLAGDAQVGRQAL